MKPQTLGELLIGKDLVFLSDKTNMIASIVSKMELHLIDTEIMPKVDSHLSDLKEGIKKEEIKRDILADMMPKVKDNKFIDKKTAGEVLNGKELVCISACMMKPEGYVSDQPFDTIKETIKTQLKLSTEDIKENDEELSELKSIVLKLKKANKENKNEKLLSRSG